MSISFSLYSFENETKFIEVEKKNEITKKNYKCQETQLKLIGFKNEINTKLKRNKEKEEQ